MTFVFCLHLLRKYAQQKEKFYRRVLVPVTCPAAPTARRSQGDLLLRMAAQHGLRFY